MSATPPSTHPLSNSNESLASRPLVLVVDDEKGQRDLLTAVLASACRVDTAASVSEAVIKAELSPPALVIMDYAMPAASGIEGLKQLRAIYPQLPVVMLTGYADLEVARQAIQLGAVEYVLKPFAPEDLNAVVAACLKLEARPASSPRETPYALQRRLAGSVDLWRSKLPSVTSANHLEATLESGRLVEAKVLRLGRDAVQVEVYEPAFWLEENVQKVSNLQIWVGGELAYSGPGELSRILPAGPTSICEFSMTNSWTDSQEVSIGSDVAELAQDFVAEWRQTARLSDAFKLAVANAATLLGELRDWLVGVEAKHPEISESKNRASLEALYEQTAPLLNEAFVSFEEEAAKIPDALVGIYAEHVRFQLHPLVLCAPFVHRCFTKPLSYPGDFGVMNYMLGDPFEGATIFAKIVNAWVIRSGTCATYRHRVQHLEGMLHSEANQVHAISERPLRVLSLGCGIAPEVRAFLQNSPRSEGSDFTLLDFNPTTVTCAREQIAATLNETQRQATVTIHEFSAQQMLAHGSRLIAGQDAKLPEFLSRDTYDVVYCAGLFDYLSDRVCQRLVEIFWHLAAPGGAVVISNCSLPNPMRGFMDYVVDWRLIHRLEDGVRDLAPAEANRALETKISPGGSEVFLHLRKPIRSTVEQAIGESNDLNRWTIDTVMMNKVQDQEATISIITKTS
ncbi:MAG: response regulator [Verrucomicrobia bacterium]|nr:response regulator [Verrucomicrobiota bacterium]